MTTLEQPLSNRHLEECQMSDPLILKCTVWKFQVLKLQNGQDLLPSTLHYIHEEKISINISAIPENRLIHQGQDSDT